MKNLLLKIIVLSQIFVLLVYLPIKATVFTPEAIIYGNLLHATFPSITSGLLFIIMAYALICVYGVIKLIDEKR